MLESLKEPASDPTISQLSVWEDRILGASLSKKYRATDDRTRTQALYVVKYPQQTGPGLSSVACELICARIGQSLFVQPVCPPFAIADPLPGRDQRGFGSKVLEGYGGIKLDSKTDIEQVQGIDSATLARIIVFHVWLVADDAAILIHENGKDALSIDHGFFLMKWQNDTHQIEVYARLLAVIDEKSIESALYELESIGEERVRKAFKCLPEGWVADAKETGLQFLAKVIVQRKAEVRAKIGQMRAR
ncbi:MAG TPA: hypothetical protein VFV38_30305 [Ktedonobacteraceae bacterium]|nr:hypothetical protein [Ktedonobacteraceae bacterium]